MKGASPGEHAHGGGKRDEEVGRCVDCPKCLLCKGCFLPQECAIKLDPQAVSVTGNTTLGNIVVLTYLQFNFSSGFSYPQFTAVQKPYMANSKSKQFQLGL